MKKLLLTTALVAISSAAFANPVVTEVTTESGGTLRTTVTTTGDALSGGSVSTHVEEDTTGRRSRTIDHGTTTDDFRSVIDLDNDLETTESDIDQLQTDISDLESDISTADSDLQQQIENVEELTSSVRVDHDGDSAPDGRIGYVIRHEDGTPPTTGSVDLVTERELETALEGVEFDDTATLEAAEATAVSAAEAARIAAEQTAATALAAEEAARLAAEANQQAINEDLRASDGVFTAGIAALVEDRDQLRDDLAAAEQAAADAASALSSAISAETTARAEQDRILQEAIAEETAARISTDELLELAIQSEVEARIAADIAVLDEAIAHANAAAARAEAAANAYTDRLHNLQQIQVDSNTSRVETLEDQWNTDPIIGATKVTDKLGNVIQHVNYNDGTTEAKVARVENIETIADRVTDNTSRIQSLESAVFKPAQEDDAVERFIADLWAKAKLAKKKDEPMYVMTSAGMVDLRGWHGSTSRTGGISIALDKTLAYDVMGLNTVWVTLK